MRSREAGRRGDDGGNRECPPSLNEEPSRLNPPFPPPAAAAAADEDTRGVYRWWWMDGRWIGFLLNID